jgi:hypothetical protein
MRKQLTLLLLIIVSFSACNKGSTYQPPPVNCDSANMKYATDIVPIFIGNCYSCHGTDSTTGSAGILLEGYNNLKPHADDGTLKGTITHTSGYVGMPYLKTKLDSCTINKILDWISEGAPNN